MFTLQFVPSRDSAATRTSLAKSSALESLLLSDAEIATIIVPVIEPLGINSLVITGASVSSGFDWYHSFL